MAFTDPYPDDPAAELAELDGARPVPNTDHDDDRPMTHLHIAERVSRPRGDQAAGDPRQQSPQEVLTATVDASDQQKRAPVNSVNSVNGVQREGGDPATHVAEVLDEVVDFVDRFLALTRERLDAIALWVAVTHAVDQFDLVPYLFVTSAEKRCGKTLLQDVLEQLVLRGKSTTNISPAALFRMVADIKPTLFIDEVDNIFSKKGSADPAQSDLVGLINAGFRRGRPAYRMGGANMRTLEEFDPFGPKALAGIGGCLPDTTADRCVPIRLTRKARDVVKARYRVRIHEPEAAALGRRVAEAMAVVDVRDAWPSLPDELNDRQQDIWEPLLAVADAAGGDWPARARAAARHLHADTEDESVGVKLLADIRTVFTTDKLLTKHLAALLNDLDESPWSEWNRGTGITSAQLVARLRNFEIRSRPLRAGDGRGRGFERGQFDDAFRRYLVDAVDSVDNESNPQVSPVNGSRQHPPRGVLTGPPTVTEERRP